MNNCLLKSYKFCLEYNILGAVLVMYVPILSYIITYFLCNPDTYLYELLDKYFMYSSE